MRRLLLDSGAFSVWNRGATIDLDAYIQFCIDHPTVSYFVNLDVIPGKPGDVKSLTKDAIEGAAQAGWDNYQKMLRRLPIEKVVPVFHQNDGFHWLEKYLDFGTPYIGISPANDRSTSQRLVWMEQVKKWVVNSAGQSIVKMHGFAVTSFRLMKFWQWESVDSASWLRVAANGSIYVPYLLRGECDYSRSPFLLSVSPKSPNRADRGAHILSCSPLIKQQMTKYLDDIGMGLGEWVVEPVEKGHRLDDHELWWDKTKTQVLRTTKKGVATCHQRRFWANVVFLKKANDVLPVEHIYFAGSGQHPKVEQEIDRRLLSYYDIASGNAVKKTFDFHLEQLG